MMAQLPCVCGHERRQHSIHRDKCLKVSESGEICPCDFFKFHADTDYFAFHAELLVVVKSFNVRWPEITQKIVEILRADRDSFSVPPGKVEVHPETA